MTRAPVAAAFLLVAAACTRTPAPVSARLLATIPDDVNVVLPAAFAEDGSRVAYVARTAAGDYAVCGDWRGKTYAVV